MKRFTLRLPDELHQKITQLARSARRSIHAQILYILENYFGVEEVVEEIEVTYWRGKDTWPYSIDEDVTDGSTKETMRVPKSETFVRDGKRYYPCVCGIGTVIDLLIGPD